jgi:hypothetical protein
VSTFKESVSQLHSRLLRCGFSYIDKGDIFSSLTAAKRFVASRNLRPMYFLEPEALEDFQGPRKPPVAMPLVNPKFPSLFVFRYHHN